MYHPPRGPPGGPPPHGYGGWRQPFPPHGVPPPQQWQPNFNIPEFELRQRIDKTLDALLKSPNPAEFVQHLRMKQAGNPDFQFLNPGGKGNDYFEGKKHEMMAGQGMYGYGPGGYHGDMPANGMPPKPPLPPLPPLNPDTRELGEKDEQYLEDLVRKLNGTKETIKKMSRWITNNVDMISGIMKKLTKIVHNIDFNNFGRKLHICYALNDTLHESMKMRGPRGQLDQMSSGILHNLIPILKSSFQGYSPKDQDQMHSLLTLWCNRQIFRQEHINYIGSMMISAPQAESAWAYFHNWGMPQPVNLLHLSPGFVIDILNRRNRENKTPAYTPLPISVIPPCMPEKTNKPPSYYLDKYDEFQRALHKIESRHRRRSRSRSRSSSSYSRSPRRDRRRSRGGRSGWSPERDYSRSSSSSRTRS